jgi:small ligand-binding sensory domain FIST
MKIQSAISSDPNSERAIEHVCREVVSGLGGKAANLALLFVSPHHQGALREVVTYLRKEVQAQTLLGCTGQGIIGENREIEGQPAISLWTAHLPGLGIQPFQLSFDQTSVGFSVSGLPAEPSSSQPPKFFLLLAEPFTTPGTEFLRFLEEQYPGIPAVGGMASGGSQPGQNRLIYNDEILEQGVVGAMISGPIFSKMIVSQGCRPIGERFIITKAERNVIYELGGKPALESFQEVYAGLPSHEQLLIRQGLHVGYAIDEQKSQFDRGDFLVRNVVGADQESGGIAITDYIKEGQTIQFHVRDAETASEDLQLLLAAHKRQTDQQVAGALLFTCNGRGQRLFGSPHHDITSIHRQIGEIPTAGLFAQGEIGPVGGKNFLHGFTASIALFHGSAET